MQLTDKFTNTPPTRSSADIFDTLSGWFENPDLAFCSWISNQEYRVSTQTVYIAMFRKFLTWLQRGGLRFHQFQYEHLGYFLDGLNINGQPVKNDKNDEKDEKQTALKKHHRYRYVRLIERAFDHMARLGYTGLNPGRKAAKEKVGVGHDDPTRFLSLHDRNALIEIIQTYGEALSQVRKGKKTEKSWVSIRDRALVAVMFGGGIKVSEAQKLSVNCIHLPEGWITVPATGKSGREHRTKLRPFAQEALVKWLALRQEMGFPGTALFPPAQHGKRSSKSPTMHAASIFRRTQAVMAAAGIDAKIETRGDEDRSNRACAQTLRNTFATFMIDEGAPDELIKEFLGLSMQVSASRLRLAYETSKPAVCV